MLYSHKLHQKAMKPPITAPAETLQLSPESLEVANCYLQLANIQQVASEMQLPVEYVTNILRRPEVRSYVNLIFADSGFNNRVTMRRAMDALLQQKFAELEQAQTGSNKDIADLLALSHKMSMDLLDREIALAKLQQGQDNIRNQVNVQINEGLGASKYASLINKLLQPDVDDKPQ